MVKPTDMTVRVRVTRLYWLDAVLILLCGAITFAVDVYFLGWPSW